MALIIKDRVRETTITTGQGAVTLAGASTGFRSFADIGNGNTTYYCISNNNEFEVGVGTYTASGTTLSRDTVLSNSLGTTALINFSDGTKDVFCTYPSSKAILGNTSAVASTGTGSVVLSTAPTITGGATIDATTQNINIGTAQTSGTLNIGTNIARTGSISIGANATAEPAISTNTFASGVRNFVGIGQSSTGSLIRIGTMEGENETPSEVEVNGQVTIGDSNYQTSNRGALNVGGTITAPSTAFTNLTATGLLSLTSSGTSNNLISTTQTTGSLTIGGTGATGAITLGQSTGAQTVQIGGTGTSIVTVGGATGTGALTFGRSTGSQTVNIATGTTAAATTKTINIGNAGNATSTTNIAIGSATGTSTTTINGTVRPSALTASQAVFTDASKNLVSVATTGTGSVVLSASPTLTGTVQLPNSSFVSGTSTIGYASNVSVGQTNYLTNNTIQIGGNERDSSGGSRSTINIGVNYVEVGDDYANPTITNIYGDVVFPAATSSESVIFNRQVSITSGNSFSVAGNFNLTGSATDSQNIATNQTSGTLTIGGTGATGAITLGRSTGSQTTNIQAGVTASGSTKAVNIGTNGAAGSTTNITIGSTTGTSTTTVNGLLKQQTYLVANLPTGSAGARSFVTNALSPTFGAAVAGGGAVGVPVYHDGTSWKVG